MKPFRTLVSYLSCAAIMAITLIPAAASGAAIKPAASMSNATTVNKQPWSQKVVPAAGIPAVAQDGKITNVTLQPADNWRTGTSVHIYWTWPGHEKSPVDISLWNGSTKVVDIVSGWTGGSVGWVVPYNLPLAAYTVKVQSRSNPANSFGRVITIDKSTLFITSPKKNDVLMAGKTYPIIWTFQGKPGPMKLELFSGSSSAPTLQIANNIPWGELGAGRFDWTVPAYMPPSGGFTIKATSLASNAIANTSDQFSIGSTGPTYDMEVLGIDPAPMRTIEQWATWSINLRNNGNSDIVQASVECTVNGIKLYSLSGGMTYKPGQSGTFLVQGDLSKVNAAMKPGSYTGSCTVGIVQPNKVTDSKPANNTKGGLVFTVAAPPTPPANAPTNMYINTIALRDCATRGAATNKAPVCAEIEGGNSGPGAVTKAWVTRCTLGNNYAGIYTDRFQYPPNHTMLNKVPLGSVAAGTYQLTCNLDVSNQLNDPNKNNNTRTEQVTVLGGPPTYDMEVLGIDPAPMRTIEQWATWSINLRNNGNSDVVQASVQCTVNGLTLTSLSGGMTYKPGQSGTFLVQGNLSKVNAAMKPGSYTGSCTVGIVQPNKVTDANPANNTKGGLVFTVAGPATPPPGTPANLYVTSLALRDCTTRGAATNKAPVCAEIEGGNGGPGIVDKPWVTRCTLGGYVGTFTDSFQYPPNHTMLNKVKFNSVPAGTYPLSCELDSAKQLTETSRSDNSKTVSVTVWP